MEVPANPAISVVVRTKERPALLAEALDSLASQELRDFEVVVVNDSEVALSDPASTSRSPLAVRVVEAGPPHGRSRALNVGVEAARGRWIAYLDDDDLFLPGHLATLLSAVTSEPGIRATYSDALLVRMVRRTDGTFEEVSRRPAFGRPFAPWRILWQNTVPLLCLLHEKGAWEEAGRFDESFDLFEDWEFLVRLFRVAPPRHVPEATALYRLRDDGSNATTASPWGGQAAREARRRVVAKHRGLRTPEDEEAFVDAAEAELSAALGQEAQLRDAHDSACREWDAAARRVGELAGELQAAGEAAARGEAVAAVLRGEVARGEALAAELRERLARAEAEREAVVTTLRGEVARTESERDAAALEARRAEEIVDRMTRSLAWRLFTPWWKLREILARRG